MSNNVPHMIFDDNFYFRTTTFNNIYRSMKCFVEFYHCIAYETNLTCSLKQLSETIPFNTIYFMFLLLFIYLHTKTVVQVYNYTNSKRKNLNLY